LKEAVVRSIVLVSAFALLVPAVAAWAEESTPTPAAAPAQTSDPDRVVCQNGPPPTGSRIGGGRICHTQREWDRMHEEQRHIIETHQTMIGTAGH
jgi:hypothetical protein